MDLANLTDAVDTKGVATNDLRSFHRADLVVEAADRQGDICYVAAEASRTVDSRDIARAIRNARPHPDFRHHESSATSNAVTLRVLRLNSTPIRWMGSPRPRYLAA